MTNRILAAVDGRPESVGALRTALWLNETGGNEVTVLTVLESVGLFDPGLTPSPLHYAGLENRQVNSLRRAVQDKIRALGADVLEDAVRVEIGPPARTIVWAAHRAGASLIVMGIGGHGAMDRLAGREVALQVGRLAHVPVLAVPRYVSALPRRVLVGLDFSSFGQETLRALPAVLAPDAEVHLAHAISPRASDSEGWLQLYAAHGPRVRQAIEQAATELELAHGIRAIVHGRDVSGRDEHAHQLPGGAFGGQIDGRRRPILAAVTFPEPERLPDMAPRMTDQEDRLSLGLEGDRRDVQGADRLRRDRRAGAAELRLAPPAPGGGAVDPGSGSLVAADLLGPGEYRLATRFDPARLHNAPGVPARGL